MPTILRAPERLSAAQRKTTTTLYLAGPIDGGGGAGGSWRDEVIDACDDLDITIIDQRNDRWPGLDAGSPGRRGAYDWQCASAYDADVVVVWVPDGSHAPTALMLLGYLAAKRGNAKRGARSSSAARAGTAWCGSSPRTTGSSPSTATSTR
ncbi:MAG: nucleoside 2-deoxyribosyltransferase domain-containing protein [Acidimicrobiales bacterium]